jgi:hypothetical protein
MVIGYSFVFRGTAQLCFAYQAGKQIGAIEIVYSFTKASQGRVEAKYTNTFSCLFLWLQVKRGIVMRERYDPHQGAVNSFFLRIRDLLGYTLYTIVVSLASTKATTWCDEGWLSEKQIY